MKKAIFYLLVGAILPAAASADEGMWLVSTFQEVIYPQMKKEGLKLRPGEIYNEHSPALCSAVVAVDGGMGTGSMISDKGLLITNHHVAYGDIHALSTPEKNYLEDGFWALEQQDELPIAGKSVTFLRKVRDVTDEALAIRDSLERANSLGIFGTRRIYGVIEKRYRDSTPFEVSCASMWKGKRYLLFYYETYRDVRLVGAPPVRIGAFGGETDNWGWPQHKGDFALYRVYGDREGKPAPYSAENIPLKPRRVLRISTGGVHDGDYAMVIGFPGRTNRYISSFAVREREHVTNPIVIRARRERLDILKRHMEADPEVRLKYSDKYFGISNYADYAKWENICLRRYDAAGIRAAEEAKLAAWIDADPSRRAEYGDLLPNLKKGYEARAEAVREKCYYQETWIRPSEVLMTANRLAMLVERMRRDSIPTVAAGDRNISGVLSNTRRMMKDFDLATDVEVLKRMIRSFTDSVPRTMWGEQLPELYDRFGGDVAALVDYAVENSCCTSCEKLAAWFAVPRTADDMLADPLTAMAYSVSSRRFAEKLRRAEEASGIDADKEEVRYAHALYEMREAERKPQYPDANSTMRITYGSVGPVSPRDAVHYASRSTVEGYLEKHDPADYEFRVDERMRSLIRGREWGRWGENGRMYANFLTDNDITGGNSGSPVLNARGEVIGLAFDGNRESMSGDVYYHPSNFKTVCVDIRFVLWIIDKYAGAGRLIDEMRLVK